MFNNEGYLFEEVSLDLEEREDNIETEYEKKFRKQGVTINYLRVSKNNK